MFYKSIINQLHQLISNDNEPNEESLILQRELILKLMSENTKLRQQIEVEKLYWVYGIKIGSLLIHKEAKTRNLLVQGFNMDDFKILSICTVCLNANGNKTSRTIDININRIADYKIIENTSL